MNIHGASMLLSAAVASNEVGMLISAANGNLGNEDEQASPLSDQPFQDDSGIGAYLDSYGSDEMTEITNSEIRSLESDNNSPAQQSDNNLFNSMNDVGTVLDVIA